MYSQLGGPTSAFRMRNDYSVCVCVCVYVCVCVCVCGRINILAPQLFF
jgi:hypothetical protein